MRILITNEDGMEAAQLMPLMDWCRKLGDVTVFVHKVEQSGKSHSFEIRKAFEVKQVELAPGYPIWYVDSTPADCVRLAVLGMHLEFDLVISGINRGLNVGTDIMYSGTVGAASEAVNLGIPAVALSTTPANYPNATAHLDEILAYFRENNLMGIHNLYNVNIPANPKGIRITHQGGPYFSDDFPPVGNDLYQPTGKPVWVDSGDLTLDTDAALTGYISIMPLTTNRTDWSIYNKLKK